VLHIHLIGLFLYFVVLISSGCTQKYEVNSYKYFDLVWLPFISSVDFSDKDVFSNVVIHIDEDKASISILCIPFTLQEYKQYLINRNEAAFEHVTREQLSLNVSGRKIIGGKKINNRKECSVFCSDYYNEMAFFILYMGSCGEIEKFKKILSMITYNTTIIKSRQDRANFLRRMKFIEDLDIPVYKNASKMRQLYSLVGLNKKITYDVVVDEYSKEVFEFYKKYFSKLGWQPHRSERQGLWRNDKLFYSWIDQSEEIVVRLLIKSNKIAKPTDVSIQTVYLDVTPYLIEIW